MAAFSYNVPYYDFSNGDLNQEDVKNAESFFDIEHVNHNDVGVTNSVQSYEEISEMNQEFYTPLKFMPEEETVETEEVHRVMLRRSVSMNDISVPCQEEDKNDVQLKHFSEALESLTLSSTKKKKSTMKSHEMVTRADIPKLHLRSRSISRDHLEKLTKPKETQPTKRYVSMAEAIAQFHRRTPARFRSKPKNQDFPTMSLYRRNMTATIPQSPLLTTKQRIRTNHAQTREEIELKAFEEAQKLKVKPLPVNPKILYGPLPLKVDVVKKSPTKVEPFKLTEMPARKVASSPKRAFSEFHAKPIPKAVLEAPKPIIKTSICTMPITPTFMKKSLFAKHNEDATEEDNNKTTAPKSFKLTPTVLMPFSFDERDKCLKKKKEQLIHEVLEEEKKAREFHARPLPKTIFKSPLSQSKISNHSIFLRHSYQQSDTSSCGSNQSMSGTSMTTHFKARPARVLQMKPFEPKKEDRHLTEITEFHFNTVQRAKEREEFEHRKKLKEERLMHCIKMTEEEVKLKEEMEALRLRKEMEFKAQPVKRYKGVKIMPANKITMPESPKFMSNKNKNKENM